MKLIFTSTGTGDECVGEDDTFGECSLNLIDNMVSHFGAECLNASLFKALSEIEQKKVVSHFDFSCPEDAFSLFLEDK